MENKNRAIGINISENSFINYVEKTLVLDVCVENRTDKMLKNMRFLMNPSTIGKFMPKYSAMNLAHQDDSFSAMTFLEYEGIKQPFNLLENEKINGYILIELADISKSKKIKLVVCDESKTNIGELDVEVGRLRPILGS